MNHNKCFLIVFLLVVYANSSPTIVQRESSGVPAGMVVDDAEKAIEFCPPCYCAIIGGCTPCC